MADTLLQRGMQGPEVRRLQQDLNILRRTQGKDEIAVTGAFDQSTFLALQQMQTELGLTREQGGADGIYGEYTHNALQQRIATAREAATALAASGVTTPAPEPQRSGGVLQTIADAFSTVVAPSAAAGVPRSRISDVPSPEGLIMPGVAPIVGTRIWAYDIIDNDAESAAVMQRTGLSRHELTRGLTSLVDALNQLDPSVRPAATLAARQLYLEGTPVTVDGNYATRSGTDTLDVRFVSLDGSHYNSEQRERMGAAANRRGLQTETSGQDGLRLSVDMHYESLDELRADLEAQYSGERIRPVSPVQVDGHRITSRYGLRNDPFHGRRSRHQGTDFAPPLAVTTDDAGQESALPSREDVPIVSAMPGRVVHVKNSRSTRGYGTEIMIEDIYGVRHRYAHLDSADVRVGQIIQQGETIGVMGNTGRSEATHLHYERLEPVERRGLFGNRYTDYQQVDPFNAGENGRDSLRIRTDENGQPARTRDGRETADTSTPPRRTRPRQLAEAATEVAERQAERVARAAAEAERVRQEVVQNVAEVTQQAASAIGNAAQGAWNGAMRMFGRG